MAINGNGAASTPPDELHEDLDALAPIARHSVTFQGARYAIRHVLDLPIVDWLALLRLEEQWQTLTQAGDSAQGLVVLQQRLAILLPDMPPEIAGRMSYQQALKATATAWRLAKESGDPPKADALPGSFSGSPASAVSTAGGPATR
jgi:hypothetical protein